VEAVVAMGRLSTRMLLLLGIAGPVLFVVVFLVAGATRAGYDATRQFISLLSLGNGGWLQATNFIVGGVLIAGFGIGLRRAWAGGRGTRSAAAWTPRLIVFVGLGLMLCGIFVTDPAQGYPPGAPAGLPTSVSWHAGLHYLGALIVFVGLPAAMWIAARRAPSANARTWAAYSLASGILMIGGWLATFVLAGPDGTLAIAGLLQRIAVVAGFQWLVATAVIELGRAGRTAAYAYA
jgi:hypothetical membrane protein